MPHGRAAPYNRRRAAPSAKTQSLHTCRRSHPRDGGVFMARRPEIWHPCWHPFDTQKKTGHRVTPMTCDFAGRVDWIRTSDPLTPSALS